MLTPASTLALDGATKGPATQAEDLRATNATLSLVTDATRVAPGGEFTLALRFDMRQDWHIYWNGRTDTGFAPSWELTLPEGWASGEAQWPAPERYVSAGDILDHVYEGRVLILIPVRVAPDAKVGEVGKIRARAKWLACHEACIPEQGEAEVAVSIATASVPDSTSAGDFATAKARIPKSLTGDAGVSARIEGDELVVEAKDAWYLAYYPGKLSSSTPNLLDEGEVEVEVGSEAATKATLRIALEPHPEAQDATLHAHGVVEVRGKPAKGEPKAKFFAIDVRATPGRPSDRPDVREETPPQRK